MLFSGGFSQDLDELNIQAHEYQKSIMFKTWTENQKCTSLDDHLEHEARLPKYHTMPCDG